MARCAKRKNALLGAGFFLVASRAAEGHIKAVQIERLLERFGLHDIGVICRAMSDRTDALGNAALVGVRNQLEPDFSRRAVSKRDNLLEFPSGIDVHQRKRDRSWV